VPNNDGIITRDESTIIPGLHAKTKIGDDTSCQTAGTGTSPNKVWDLTGMMTGDHDVTIETLSMDPADPKALWCAADFPGASYAAPMADPTWPATHTGHDEIGVFKLTATDLLLLGACSSKSKTQTTKWTEVLYATPLTVLHFPVHLNDTWTTTSFVTGTFEGTAMLPGATLQSTSTVDARGTVKTPLDPTGFPVLRVHTQAIAAWGFLQTTTQNHALLAECYGTVATFLSPSSQFTTDYTTCSEVWRLTP
jgi:hypothetical protein